MTRIVTTAHRYKPPPRKRKAVAIAALELDNMPRVKIERMFREDQGGNAMPQPPRRPLNYEPALSDPMQPAPPPPPSPRSKPPSPPRRSCAWCQRVRIWLGLGAGR